MSQENLVKFYSDLLYSLDCIITEDDKILLANNTPITIMMDKKEKQLILPTKVAMKHGDWVNSVGFHPACESAVAGQSQVVSLILRLMGFKIYDVVQKLTSSIITLGIKTEEHEKLTLAQLELLKNIGAITKNTEKVFLDVLKNLTGITGKSPLFTLRLHRGGIIEEESFSRTFVLTPSVINNNLYNDLLLKSHTETNKKTLIKIYKIVFPEKLSYGSNHNVMPYFIVMLTAFYNIAVHLNRIKMLLDKYTTVPEISLSWHSEIKHLTEWSKSIPILRGNTGEASKVAETTDEKVETVKIPPIANNLVIPELKPSLVTNQNTGFIPPLTQQPLAAPIKSIPIGGTKIPGLGISLDIPPNKPPGNINNYPPQHGGYYQQPPQFQQQQFVQQTNNFQQQQQFNSPAPFANLYLR